MNTSDDIRQAHRLHYAEVALPGTTLMCNVGFEYTPAERQTFESPGCEADVEIIEVRVNGVDIEQALTDRVCDQIANLLVRAAHKQRDRRFNAQPITGFGGLDG